MDDVILHWNYGELELLGFLNHLHTYDRNFRFTLKIDTENKLSLLEALISRNTDKLDFTINRKPTQKQKISSF